MLMGFLGGALIGLAATLYFVATGRTAGVSGILGGALGRDREARGERIAFLAGLVGVGLLTAVVSSPAVANPYPLPLLVVAGVLVGFGTRLGGGCTSGHGVCGISRFSIASLIATATFIAAGAATVAIAHRLLASGVAP
ncbi:MAG TPA: YeeE/YedE family protein [Polyangia bacterium]|nr:YeeE/YedE family protein [Polyangia bacterium]